VDSRALNILDAHVDSAQTESLRKLSQPRLVESNIDKSSKEHVSSDSAGRIEYGDLHDINLILHWAAV
jgi:hypothetical protein